MKAIEDSTRVLPYSKSEYREYLEGDTDSNYGWTGVSFQIPNGNDFSEKTELLAALLRSFVDQIGTGEWIVEHLYGSGRWFRDSNADNFPALKQLFIYHRVDLNYAGPLLLDSNELLEISGDLVSYPSIVSSHDVDISCTQIPLIFKTTNHHTVDVLCQGSELLERLVSTNPSKSIIFKRYR